MFRRHSTESVVRNAIHGKKDGLSSQELGQLSELSYNPAGLRELQNQLSASLCSLSQMHRKHGPFGKWSVHDRGNVLSGLLPSRFRADVNIVVVKCLSIIIYLCQTGSAEFLSWIFFSYRTLIVPILKLAFDLPLFKIIMDKAQLVIGYCEDSRVLAQARTFNKTLKSQWKPGHGTIVLMSH